MKDAYIYNGSGWQSLKGPPGPSEPSKDAGNVISKGSDGLLHASLQGPSKDARNAISVGSDRLLYTPQLLSGLWTPALAGAGAGGGAGSVGGSGYWEEQAAGTVRVLASLPGRLEFTDDDPVQVELVALPFEPRVFVDDGSGSFTQTDDELIVFFSRCWFIGLGPVDWEPFLAPPDVMNQRLLFLKRSTTDGAISELTTHDIASVGVPANVCFEFVYTTVLP